jgi:putative endonuclease
MFGYMYILDCAKRFYYTGSTIDLEKRLCQHENGEGSNFTKKYLPVELVYLEIYPSIEDAYYREKQVQGWSRKKKEALINGEFDHLPNLSMNRFKREFFASYNSGKSTFKEIQAIIDQTLTLGKPKFGGYGLIDISKT